jgi:cell division initiation protein
MKITPLEIKRQEFGKSFRGYSSDEVRTYLEMVAEEFENLLKKNLELEESISSLKTRLSDYTRIEGVLQDTLVTTQKSAEEYKTAAEQKARAMIDEARVSADRILASAQERLLSIQREIADLRHQREAFIANFKSLIETQRTLLENLQNAGETKSTFRPVRMKPEMSDEDLEKVVSEFERQLPEGESQENTDRIDNPPGGETG